MYGLVNCTVFKCDCCGIRGEYVNIIAAKKDGWKIDKNRVNCYCRNCNRQKRAERQQERKSK